MCVFEWVQVGSSVFKFVCRECVCVGVCVRVFPVSPQWCDRQGAGEQIGMSCCFCLQIHDWFVSLFLLCASMVISKISRTRRARRVFLGSYLPGFVQLACSGFTFESACLDAKIQQIGFSLHYFFSAGDKCEHSTTRDPLSLFLNVSVYRVCLCVCVCYFHFQC